MNHDDLLDAYLDNSYPFGEIAEPQGGPMSDLLYVERVSTFVVGTLLKMTEEAEDVEVAAKYQKLSREFPLVFLHWAAGTHELDETMDPKPATAVQRACEEIPLFAALDEQVSAYRPDKTALPAICIEALVLVNAAIPKNAAARIEVERKAEAVGRQINQAYQNWAQQQDLHEVALNVKQLQAKMNDFQGQAQAAQAAWGMGPLSGAAEGIFGMTRRKLGL